MIGISALILPVVGLQTGYLTIVWVCLLMGYISYYTASLIVVHMGQSKNIKESILSHFNNNYNYMIFYSGVIWLSFFPVFVSFFRLLCLQIIGLLGYNSGGIGPVVAVFLLILVIISRKYHYWEEVLALGIPSVIVLFIFITWALITAP